MMSDESGRKNKIIDGGVRKKGSNSKNKFKENWEERQKGNVGKSKRFD